MKQKNNPIAKFFVKMLGNEKYSKEGYKKFNFGGISNPNLKDNQYKGLNDFKLNFGSKVYEFIGDFELIINNAKYFMYKNVFSLKSILKK